MLIDSPKPRYDIVIVGAGMVGASFAVALQGEATARYSVLVLEAFPLFNSGIDRPEPSFDARSTALSGGSAEFLGEIDLWDSLSQHATPIEQILVSDQGRFGTANIDSQEQRVEALGHVVENQQIGSVLRRKLEQTPQLDVLAPAKISTVKPIANGMQVNLDLGGKHCVVEGSLVVLADGGKSPICKSLGIDSRHEDYKQSAIISNISFENPHRNRAFERFTQSGPLAVLPLSNFEGRPRASLVWSVESEHAQAMIDLPEAEFLSQLQAAFGHRLGRINGVGERFCFPLRLSVAKEQIRPGLVLLGNVAHNLHPVAGQGFNLALRDVRSLVGVLRECAENSANPGDMSTLLRYLDAQRGDQEMTIQLTHLLTKAFSNNRRALVLLRKLGLLSIDLLPSIRNRFARQAMGLGIS
ncbi:MAG: 2-octaprenyl-6-methoxyphenyl hydroxylase [Pseudohongiella sp.]|nr:MAG: 2-octaprenyl-6-methoxyphenyl hydroxylase [Pseudohongiella sp.]